MMKRALASFVMALLPAGPVLAAGTFALPDGCTGYVTIQSHSCAVEHHFTCERDPDGVKRRIILSESGMTYLGTTDTEAQWLASFYPRTGHEEVLEAAPVDPASLSELLKTGKDSYDFRTLSDQVGETHYVGYDQLTGRTVTIDDVTLQETAYEMTAYGPDDTRLWSSKGNEYVNANWRSFHGGTGMITMPDEAFEKDDRPVEFIFPGEDGFLSRDPKFDCGAVLSSLSSVRP